MADIPSLYHLTGLQPMAQPARDDAPTMQAHATTEVHPALYSPDNPLFWFGLVLAATVGLVAVSGSVRLGKAKVAASIGSTS